MLIILSCATNSFFVSCKSKPTANNKIEIDSLYSYLYKEFIETGECFKAPPLPFSNIEDSLRYYERSILKKPKVYYYFDNEFLEFYNPVGLNFKDENFANFIYQKTKESSRNVIQLNNTDMTTFKDAKTIHDSISINVMNIFIYELISKEKDFMGFIHFSKPRYRIIENQITEYYVRMSWFMGSNEDCFLKATCFQDSILKAEKIVLNAH